MKKVCWLDVDGVLLDYTSAFLDFARPHMKEESKDISYGTLLDYDLTRLFHEPDICYGVMKEFASSQEFANLPVHTDAFYLHALKNAGYDLRIITQLTAPPHARKNRIANLTNVYGGIFSEIVFTEHGQCKLEYLAMRYMNDMHSNVMGSVQEYILVEDNPKLLLKAATASYKFIETLGIHHPYNQAALSDIGLPMFASFVGVYHMLVDRVVV